MMGFYGICQDYLDNQSLNIKRDGISLFFDGSCDIYSGWDTSSWGFVVFKDDEILFENFGVHLYNAKVYTSCNVAEYLGLINGFDLLLHNGYDEVEVYGDSMLVIKQMKGDWRIKQGPYVKLAIESLELRDMFVKICFTCVPMELNSYADDLSKRYLSYE